MKTGLAVSDDVNHNLAAIPQCTADHLMSTAALSGVPLSRSDSISERTNGIKSLGWAGLTQAVGLMIRLGSNLLLARMLAPESYGILGSAMAALTTLEWLSDMGILPALIRHERGNELSYLLTGWWIGLARGIVISLSAVVAAGPLAAFSRQPALVGILIGLSIRPLIFALRSPGIPALKRSLNYRALFIDEITQTVIGTLVSLTMVWATHSIWAIVAGTLAGALSGVIVSYRLAPLRPRLCWNPDAARDIDHFGRQVFLNTLIMAIWLNMDRLIGLRFVSLSAMGVYAVAWNLASVLEALVTRACDVYFTMLARRGDASAQADWHFSLERKLTCVVFPLGITAIALSPPAIRLLYDPRYAGAQAIFAIMVSRLLMRSLGQFHFQYLLAGARVHLATRAYGVALVLQVLLVALLVPQLGTTGLALAALGSTTVLTFVQTWLISRGSVRDYACFAMTFAAVACGLILAAVQLG